MRAQGAQFIVLLDLMTVLVLTLLTLSGYETSAAASGVRDDAVLVVEWSMDFTGAPSAFTWTVDGVHTQVPAGQSGWSDTKVVSNSSSGLVLSFVEVSALDSGSRVSGTVLATDRQIAGLCQADVDSSAGAVLNYAVATLDKQGEYGPLRVLAGPMRVGMNRVLVKGGAHVQTFIGRP